METQVHPGFDVYRFVIRPCLPDDPRSAGFLAGAHALGIPAVTGLECQDLYFLEGQFNVRDLERIASELLSDPITQTAEWGRFVSPLSTALAIPTQPYTVEVALLPGITDPVAEQLLRALKVLGISGVRNASSGQRFILRGELLGEEEVHQLTRRLLANPIIQRYALGEIEPVFPRPARASGWVEQLPLRELDTALLLALSEQRRAALDLPEMQAIQAYYCLEGRDPTDVEFETIAQTWSEHCVHKTFRAKIELNEKGALHGEGELGFALDSLFIDDLLHTYLRSATEQIAAPWVRSAFVDNAGIIDFDDQYEISFKVETHNHPSAVEPFGGANTGVGGVIRDILGVSAKPIAATDILCFGPQNLELDSLPAGVLHPRRIHSGVVSGVQDYANKIGIPTVNGAILYDAGFTANPLVFCGCVGIAPKGSHPRRPKPGDRVVILGGRTGRDGLRGATFSSMTMDAQTGEVAGASVQIGDPIVEKGLIEVITRARDLRLYHAITDCGAGGLSSAVGEMARHTGSEVELKHVQLKYPGLAPWEIWLSEAQERMVLAVPVSSLPELVALCSVFEVELTEIGVFTSSGRLIVHYDGQVVLDLENTFLHAGLPQKHLSAQIQTRKSQSSAPRSTLRPPSSTSQPSSFDFNAPLLALLSHPNIASKADVIRIYDHEVQGGTIVKPLTGVMDDGPSDACVLKPFGASGQRGIVLSNGINPQYGKLDPYRMALSVVDEAIRNAVAVGADLNRLALLDNFCWGDPKRPETLGALVAAARGCYDAALHYRTPFISGKDSLNNEYLGSDGQRHAIPPTLLISAIGVIPDISLAVTMDLKAEGDVLYLVGEHQPRFGGSHFAEFGFTNLKIQELEIPPMPLKAPEIYHTIQIAMQARLVRACHDLSEGGLSVAAAEMCIGGRLGLLLDPVIEDSLQTLFGETNGCLLVEVSPPDCPDFEVLFRELPCQRLGVVTREPRLVIRDGRDELLSLPVSDLVLAWSQVS